MAGIPQNFQSLSPVLANYDFVDIAAGTGYINFYAGTTVDLRVLTNFTFYSDTLFDEGTTAENVYTLVFDHDYDVVLNRPLDVRGIGIVSIPIRVTDDDNAYLVVTLRKVTTGAVESDIVTNTSRVFNPTVADSYNMLAIDLNIPLTHFKVGETLRLSVAGYLDSTVGTASLKYGHDPKARSTSGVTGTDWDTTGAVTSQFLFVCPVRLNL